MGTQRNYDTESRNTPDHQYAYDFDFDVMHKYVIRSMAPYFVDGTVLELGCFRGDFTKRLLQHFTTVTCIEASGEAAKEAAKRLGDAVRIIYTRFEDADLEDTFDNVILTHVLEHVDDRKALLTKIRTKWLSPNGRLFVACPNAMAASRQIAVHMGLVEAPESVTSSEEKHGHRITYTGESLTSEINAAGLKVVHRCGVFFKPFANFQWDRILKTDIVSQEYLDGCYALGKDYPELCASILAICEC